MSGIRTDGERGGPLRNGAKGHATDSPDWQDRWYRLGDTEYCVGIDGSIPKGVFKQQSLKGPRLAIYRHSRRLNRALD